METLFTSFLDFIFSIVNNTKRMKNYFSVLSNIQLKYIKGKIMLRIAICDDNSVQLDIIQKELEKTIPEDISYSINTFDSETAFTEMLKSGSCIYDIIFMDIVLGDTGSSGIDLVHKVNFLNPECQIIYISQYLEFAPDVYDTQHVYFVNKERISEFLDKALDTALKNIIQADTTHYLYFNIRKKQYKIPQNDILYMERNLRETTIVTRTEKFKTSESIDSLLKHLPSYFIVCHRSYAVNLKLAGSIHQYSISFPNGKSVPVGRTHYANVKKAFALMNSYFSL